MHENKLGSKIIKGLLIGISILFLFVMLILPLITVFSEAFKQGWEVYIKAITDEYTIKATILTLEATLIAVAVNTIFGVFAAWAITKFRFKGKKSSYHSYRFASYSISYYCWFNFYTYIRQTEYTLSTFTTG